MCASILRLSPPFSNTLFESNKTSKSASKSMAASAPAYQKLLSVGTKIIAVGRNYAAHAKELGNAVPKEPVLFLKPTSSYLENGGKIEVPEPLESLDHEVELAVIIGKRGRDVPEATAMDYIGGYALALDMTAREIQSTAKSAGLPWSVAKGQDTFTPISSILPKSMLADPHNVELWLNVDGEVRQRGSTGDMIFKIPFLISHISSIFTLLEGDVILTGTPPGVGPVKIGQKIDAGITGMLDVHFDVGRRHRCQTSQSIPRSLLQNVQPPYTNGSNGPKSWKDQEDIALMSSWCIINENSIVGTNQNSATLWQRVLDLYEQARAGNSKTMGDERSTESLRNRYKRLNTNVTKWISAYKEAYGRKKSGMSQKDIEKEAQTIYGKSKFTHHEVFEQVMRNHPKWELKIGGEDTCSHPDDENNIEEGRGSSKRSRIDEDGDAPTDSTSEIPVSDASTIRRPVGRDKADALWKGKGAIPQHSTIRDEFTAELRTMRIIREKELDTMTRLGEMRMKSAMLNTLIGKSHLSPAEEDLRHRLMTQLFPK